MLCLAIARAIASIGQVATAALLAPWVLIQDLAANAAWMGVLSAIYGIFYPDVPQYPRLVWARGDASAALAAMLMDGTFFAA